jgi:hypothetical protein
MDLTCQQPPNSVILDSMTIISIRRWHSYIGLFIAPSVLFFSLTGATQLFSLHEAHGKYQPPMLVEKLSSVHKDQVFALGNHHPAPDSVPEAGKSPGDTQSAGGEDDGDKLGLSTLLLKGFFLLVALCLCLSTSFGLWMGLTQSPRKKLGWLLVVAGSLIPVTLLLW